MRPINLLQSTGVRTALLYAVLFSASVIVLFGVVYWQSAGYVQRQMREAVNDDVRALHADYRQGGMPRLRQALQERLKDPDSAYLVQDSTGTALAGNLPAIALHPGWQELLDPRPRHRDDEPHYLLGRSQALDANHRLFVAHDAHQLHELRELLMGSFGWALAATLLFAIGGGIVMSRRMARRVDAVSELAGAIVAGDLSRRIPVRETDDEFDRLGRHLNRMLDRIQDLMENTRQVSSDIAHDLRTPLGRLRQRLEEAQRSAHNMDTYATAVDEAIGEVDEILATFSALLRIAQIEAGNRRARFLPVDLSELMRSLAEIYAPVAEESARMLTTEIVPGVLIDGDRELLTQLFVNLIENALRHTPPGSRIRLQLRGKQEAVIASVSDDGPGIPAAEREKVLRRFYRLEKSRSTPGSGLGLSLVAAVTELHGGTLSLAENAPGLKVELHLTPRA